MLVIAAKHYFAGPFFSQSTRCICWRGRSFGNPRKSISDNRSRIARRGRKEKGVNGPFRREIDDGRSGERPCEWQALIIIGYSVPRVPIFCYAQRIIVHYGK